MKARTYNATESWKEHDSTIARVTHLVRFRKASLSSKESSAAFTLTELCVVIAVVVVLAMLVLPALAATKTQSASAGCLYNLRHLQTGCAMYATENNDYLMPNAPLQGVSANTWCGSQGEDWYNSAANTNAAQYTGSLMWPYVGNNLRAYRCPGDVVPSANGTRIRSYSMNGQMGSILQLPSNPGWKVFLKGSDLTTLAPVNAFVFCDESMYSLNDGFLQVDCNNPGWPDVPACYLEGGCGFSFADGHAEVRRWLTSALKNVPYVYGIGYPDPAVAAMPGGKGNLDWVWFTQHATSHQ